MFRFLFLNLIFISFFLPSLISAEEPSALCNNNEECENKITEFTKKLNELGSAKNTLANQIKIIDSQVQLTLIKITQTQNSIKTLEKEIADLTVKIDNLDVSLNELTAVYINQISQNYKLQKKLSPVSGFFFNKSFNSFLEQYKYISVLQKNSQDTIVSMETVRTNYDIQKEAKNKKQIELEDLKKTLASQQVSLDKQKKSKNALLETTKNDEKKYQQLLTQAQSQLAALKSFSSSAGGSSCLSSSPGEGNDHNFYSQRDPRWCKQYIGNSRDTIGEVGCFISSVSMVYKKLNSDISPSAYAANSSNFWSNTAYMSTPSPPSGYTYKQVSYSASTVDNELKAGRYVIAQMRMASTAVGMHFVVIIDGSNGNYKIHDPWYGPDQNLNEHYSVGLIMSLRLITK